MRPLTLLQRQKITLSLFFAVAVGAVVTVATPAFVPWQVVDEKRAQALDQQRRQGKDFHVIEDHRQRNIRQKSSATSTSNTTSTSKGNESQFNRSTVGTTPSSQGPLISLLTDRSKPSNQIPESSPEESPSVDPTSDPNTTKKRRRRRKRKMVNEGWQEFTGRTAREEKEKQDQLHHPSPSTSSSDSSVVGENGGIEINWRNKTL
ncbi:hypothetical protein BGZ76_008199 [Entomortierella beljakovae]|nr:hypothetical protein BGZ76_008199 [Entomortierella beljakovae]